MKIMKRRNLGGALMILLPLLSSCSRKPAQTAPPPPEVLVTTATPRDVPRVLERLENAGNFSLLVEIYLLENEIDLALGALVACLIQERVRRGRGYDPIDERDAVRVRDGIRR